MSWKDKLPKSSPPTVEELIYIKAKVTQETYKKLVSCANSMSYKGRDSIRAAQLAGELLEDGVEIVIEELEELDISPTSRLNASLAGDPLPDGP